MTFRFVALLISVGVAVVGCGSSGPRVTLQFGTFTRADRVLGTTKLCLKRLRFKQEDTATNTGSDNVDYAPGLVTLASSGTTLQKVTLAKGTYKRLEFDLEKNCLDTTTPNSVDGSNGSGAFTSDQTITIKFQGTFAAADGDQTLALGIQNIVNALDGLPASSTAAAVKTALEGASGSF